MAFNEAWLAEDYFQSGSFLGAATVDALVVMYLFAIANAATGSDSTGSG